MLQDRRGVSETIGFVLVFSLIVLTVGVVLTAGYGGLQDARDAERVNNAERAFDVFADNVEDITHHGAPSRGTEIRLAEATISSGPPTYLNVSGFNASGTNRFTTGNYSIDPVVYRAEDTRVRYSAGAVTRIQTDGAGMVEPPEFVLSQDHVIVPIIQLSVEEGAVSGSKTVLVRTERNIRRDVVDDSGTVDTLRLNISTPAPDPWEQYLERQGMNCTRLGAGGGERAKLTCTKPDVERVRVVWYQIRVSFS
ncbi:MAG: hypothetical protein V5A38_13215 [Halolamina sp.]|uniref:DUF7289 family protein n=1 Tax=Halolamina sp. TaxID=1940283 RepID=UPI002FC3A6A5